MKFIGLFIAVICLFLNSSAQNDETVSITFSGTNTLEALVGKRENSDIDFFNDGDYFIKPWYYVQDLFDFDVGIQNFSFRGRFKVDAPSKGYDPLDTYLYRELIDRRTFSYNGTYLRVDAGHFKTTFGRGLTFHAAELPTIERSSLLDGVFLLSSTPLLKAQGFIGRDARKKISDSDDNTVNKGQSFENYKYRNTIFGAHGESYLFSYIPGLSFLSASSVGGGVSAFRSKVLDLQDTTINGDLFFYQPRILTTLPSAFLNVSLGDVTVYGEHARMITNSYSFIDSLQKEVAKKYLGFGTYVSVGALIWDFYILGEYINYYFGRDNNVEGYDAVKEYIAPPLARFKPDWQLLEKKSGTADTENSIGYNLELEWNLSDNTAFIITGNTGGKRKEEDSSPFLFSDTDRYWELYAQWNQKFGDLFSLKTGFDFGPRDIEIPDAMYMTLGSVLDIGPVNDNHSFAVKGEIQQKKELFYSVKDLDAMKVILKPYLVNAGLPDDAADSVVNNAPVDTLRKFFSDYVPAKEKEVETTHTPLNYLVRLTYNFSPWFSVAFHFEQEMKFLQDWLPSDRRDLVILTKDIISKTRLYAYSIVTVKPVERIKLTIEGGTFGQRCQCSPAGCSTVPAFKGAKFTMEYAF